jgi:hypothetical protein
MSFTGTNAPTQLDMSRMIAALDGNHSVVKGCRFVVRINLSPLLTRLSYSGNIQNLIYACEATELPGRTFQVTEIRYYGPKQLMPNNTSYGDGINLSFICRSKTLERQFFDDWMDIINPPNSYHFKYPNEYYTDLEIFQYAEFGSLSNFTISNNASVSGMPPGARADNKFTPQPIYAWKIKKAWPVMVNPQQVTWADSDVLRLQVTFAYKNWERQGDSEQIGKKVSL